MQFFSLGIPAHNEEASIGRMIARVVKSVAWKNHQGRREIIVCANACTDNTVEVVRNLQRSYPEIKLIESPVKSKNQAWEAIVKRSNPRAENLFFADADVLIAGDAFDRLDEALRANKSKVIAGASIIPSWNYTRKKDTYERDYSAFIKTLQAFDLQGLRGALYAIRRSAAQKTRMPANAQIADDYFLQAKYIKEFIIVPSAKVVFRPPNQNELSSALVRSTLSMRVMQQDPTMRHLVEGSKTARAFKRRALPFAWKLGLLRTARIYWAHLHKSKATREKINDLIARQADVWPQVPSSKLQQRRRPAKK